MSTLSTLWGIYVGRPNITISDFLIILPSPTQKSGNKHFCLVFGVAHWRATSGRIGVPPVAAPSNTLEVNLIIEPLAGDWGTADAPLVPLSCHQRPTSGLRPSPPTDELWVVFISTTTTVNELLIMELDDTTPVVTLLHTPRARIAG
jgi:hypothetical protein